MSRLDETLNVHRSPGDLIERAVTCCRAGDWATGLEHLETLALGQKEGGKLPGRYYSYLGYGSALTEKTASKRQRKIEEGIKLCRYSVKVEFFQGDNWWNLSRIYLLAGRKRAAYKALAKGLEIDADHPELIELRKKEFGERRPPVLPFFSRRNILNRILGHLRAAGGSASKKPKEQPGKKKVPAAKSRAKRA